MKKSSNSPPDGRKSRLLSSLNTNLVRRIGLLLVMALLVQLVPLPHASASAQPQVIIDTAGTQWRVLTTDIAGNRLIISEYVYGVGTQFNTTNGFIRWHNLTNQPIRTAMNNFWTNNVGSDVKSLALPANNLDNDVRTAPGTYQTTENAFAGWTSAGSGTPTAQNALFILSLSEMNRYASAGSLNVSGAAASWWLRSPAYDSSRPVTSVDTGGGIYAREAYYTGNGFRPALWVRSESSGGGDLPTWMQNSPTPITFPNTPTQLPPHLLNSPTPITFVPTATPLPGHLLTPKVAHNANG